MSSTVVLSQLRGLTEKAEKLKGKLDKISPTDDQWNSLIDSSLHLANAASQLQEKMEILKISRTKRAWKESEKHRSQARSLSGELFTTGRLKQSAVFRRNIVVIFEGPKTSTFDSGDAKVRKESTRKRCDVIRNLSPDGIVSWAIAYAPTLWAGGSMASDVFDCLTSDIEPDVVQTWPTVIRETLHKLKDDEAYLRSSLEYGKFLQAIDNPPSREQGLECRRKRRRVEDSCATTHEINQPQQLACADETHTQPTNIHQSPRIQGAYKLLERSIPVDPPTQFRPADHQSVVNFKFTELLSFLRRYQDHTPNLCMVCSWGGEPLPFIDITLGSARARMEFSIQLSEALMRHVLNG